MKKKDKPVDFVDPLEAYEESCMHLRAFAALLDCDEEIYDETRDEVSALFAHLMRSHTESSKKLIEAMKNGYRAFTL